mmetsp:Transcript_1515/g.2128  ORF Transcript_1515/g.2128 Transcript_1515/m.2128 type:complete len:88 (+) Transcript_1515:1046-1309(+)
MSSKSHQAVRYATTLVLFLAQTVTEWANTWLWVIGWSLVQLAKVEDWSFVELAFNTTTTIPTISKPFDKECHECQIDKPGIQNNNDE